MTQIDRTDIYGVYIHIPFCIKKCAYCDFISYPGQLSRADCYLEQVFCEMEHYRGCRADTVYIGGGTPTCLSAEQLCALLSRVRACFRLAPDCEVTVECNPKTADEAYFRAIRAAGANRLSIGAQSFWENELHLLGRLHSAGETERCVRQARRAGFSNLGLDLMFGLPGQTAEDVLGSAKRALALSPEHLSAYSLTLEEGTPLAARVRAGELTVPEEEREREMYHLLVRYLAENGYRQYEISNFSLPGRESRHNLKYWERKPYIGLGAAAHSQIGKLRFWNPDGLDAYGAVSRLAPPEGRESERLAQADEMAEFMLLGLRRTRGISKKRFEEEFGRTVESVYGGQIRKFRELGLLAETETALRLTERGIDVSNAVFCEFLPE